MTREEREELLDLIEEIYDEERISFNEYTKLKSAIEDDEDDFDSW